MTLSEYTGTFLQVNFLFFSNDECFLFRGAQAAIVVYDITNADTFERAKSWVKELQRQVSVSHSWK